MSPTITTLLLVLGWIASLGLVYALGDLAGFDRGYELGRLDRTDFDARRR